MDSVVKVVSLKTTKSTKRQALVSSNALVFCEALKLEAVLLSPLME